MAGPWLLLRRAAEVTDLEDEDRRVSLVEEAVGENRRLDALLEGQVERLERAVAGLLERAAGGEGSPSEGP